MSRFAPDLNLGLVRSSIHGAREVFRWFGRVPVNSDIVPRFLERWNVETVLCDLPRKHAATLSPLLLGRVRVLTVATHVPLLARKLVLLHEAGHLYQATASEGITYDFEDYRSHDEQAADVFAAVALLPTRRVECLIENCVSAWEREDAIAAALMDYAEGIWQHDRARFVARNRIRVWAELAV